MRIAQEEIFGPVVCVIKYNDEDEAVAIANDSIYGLAGGVFSTSTARAEASGPPDPHRHDVDQQLPRLRRVLPLRRLQAVGRGPRAGQVGARRVHADQANPRSRFRRRATRTIPFTMLSGQQEDGRVQLQLPDGGYRRARLPVGDLQGGRGAGLQAGDDTHRPRRQGGRTGGPGEERARRLLRGHLRQDPAGPGPGIGRRRRRDGARAGGGLHRQRRRRKRDRRRQDGLRGAEERRQGKRLHQPLVRSRRAANAAHRRSDDGGHRQRGHERRGDHEQERRAQAVHRRSEDHAERGDPRPALHDDAAQGYDGRQRDGRDDARGRSDDEHHGEPDLRRPGAERDTPDQREPASCRRPTPTTRRRG